MSDIPLTRGAKEVVNGYVVDSKGVRANIDKLEETLLKLGSGEPVSQNQDSDDESISSKEAVEDEDFTIDEEGCHLDKDSLLSFIGVSPSSLPKKSNKSKNTNKSSNTNPYYSQIIEELNNIPISEETYETDVKIIIDAIREASRNLKVKRIVANTMAIAKNAKDFYYTKEAANVKEGMRVVFSILGNKFSMSAKGNLTGTEAFYIQVNGDTLDGIVLRKNSGEYEDVTENFIIEIKRVQ